jgi:hypothetical protein
MAVAYDKKSQLFQVNYQSPFGGIDSSAYASAIDPHNFAQIVTGVNNANLLSPISWSSVLAQTLAPGQTFAGYIPLSESSVLGFIITSDSVIQVSSDGAGGVTYGTPVAYAPANSNTAGYFSYLVIDNQIFWTMETWQEIWVYNIATAVASLDTNYVGGGYLGLLDNQLINLGGVSAADGLVPYRISWSAPGECGLWDW